MSSTTVSLHQLSLYNVGRMTSEQIIAAFNVRQQQLQRLLGDIAAEKPESRAQHHLIVGQRGMGKTMLLARIAAELRTDATLSQRFIPLVFAEEQYAVDRLSKFWLNCLDSLADARELAGDKQAVDAIDATVARLTSRTVRAAKEDQSFADEVYEAFATAAAAGGQRPVLLVDNLQIVFERLEERQQHSLRELLMRPGSPILIGASPSPPPQSQDYGAPFYDHFKVHYLRPLDEEEMRSLLVRLAELAGRDDVRQRVLDHPERLKVLRQLTGGNPRTTVTLFFLYAEDFAPTVFGDLEGLLDRVTPLYKARFEELSPQQQVVASAIANRWDPLTAATLTELTALPASTISSQLDRLEKVGFIERTELFGETRTGYQIAERFFNIWFLMRSASRRQRREVEFLTRFLESFYEPSQRTQLAQQLLTEEHFSPDRYILSHAVAATLAEPATAEELRRHADLAALHEQAEDARARLHELIDFSKLQPATLAFDELRRKLMSLVPNDADVTPAEFAKAVLGDRAMFLSRERERLASHAGKLRNPEVASVLDAVATARTADERRYSSGAVEWFSERLRSGQLRAIDDLEDWNRALVQAKRRLSVALILDSVPRSLAARVSTQAEQAVYDALAVSESSTDEEWMLWAYSLAVLDRHTEAEKAYLRVLAGRPTLAIAWNNLGFTLKRLGKHKDAIRAYRTALQHDSSLVLAWTNLAAMLMQESAPGPAEEAYKKAVLADPGSEDAMLGLADVLSSQPDRREEAESILRQLLIKNPRHSRAWTALGRILAATSRLGDAEEAYRQGTVLDPADPWPWAQLADVSLLRGETDEFRPFIEHAIALNHSDAFTGNVITHLLRRVRDYTAAEEMARHTLKADPENVTACQNLGLVLIDRERYAEAENAFRNAIRVVPTNAWSWFALGNTLRDFRGQPEAAEDAYRQALAQDPKHIAALNALGNLYCDHLGRFDDARQAFDDALAIDARNVVTIHNALFLARDFVGDVASARPLLHRLHEVAANDFADTLSLQETLFAAYDGDWNTAEHFLGNALAVSSDLAPVNTDDWMRATAVLLHLNYGKELLGFLDERGDTARLRPWVEAIRAIEVGDRRQLLNVAPEVRTTAEILYAGIEMRLKKLPDHTRRRSVVEAKPRRKKR